MCVRAIGYDRCRYGVEFFLENQKEIRPSSGIKTGTLLFQIRDRDDGCQSEPSISVYRGLSLEGKLVMVIVLAMM